MIGRANMLMGKPKGTGILRLALAAVLASAPLLWASNTTRGPDTGNYTATDSTVYSFVDLASAGGSASVLSDVDDGVALLTMPFAFQFYGNSYTQVCVSANGAIYFVTSAAACTLTSDFVNADLSSMAPPGDLPSVFPYWTDLTFQMMGAGAVYYQTQGAAGSRQFIIEWSNAYLQGSPNQVTFEAILSEGTNQILFQYQSVDFGQGIAGTDGSLATVGIRDAGGQANGRVIAWSYDASVLTNGSAILFSSAGAGQVSNTITTSPAGLSVTIDGTSYPTPKVVNWTPGSTHTLSVLTPQTNGGTGTQYAFTAWSTGDTTAQITVAAPATGTTYTANFATQYQLTTAANPANGGTVSGGGFYNANSSVSVQATPASGFSFTGFSGALSGTTNPQSLTITGPMSVTANFQGAAVVSNLTSSVANGSYSVGATIPISITFSKSVNVTGTPLLALNSGGTAAYTSGSGTSMLTFTYTVAIGQNSPALDAASTSALTLDGGTIVDTNSLAASLTLPAPGSALSLAGNKAIVIDTTAPTVVSYLVNFGSQSFNLSTSTRNRLPWQITGITVVFSKSIATATTGSLGGAVTPIGVSGLGTNTLTWPINSLVLGSFATTLAGSGTNAIKDGAGNALTGGAGFNQTLKVLYGDFNDDGVVNSSDLTLVNNARAAPYSNFADINGDGVVNATDVAIVRSRLGTVLP
jgi:hypothetical protein